MKDKLRTRVILVTVLAAICSSLVLFLISDLVLTRNYRKLERESLATDLGRVTKAIDAKFSALDALTKDWANWDDTYAFVLDRNENYLDSNFTDSTFSDLKINLIAIVDVAGHTVTARNYDLDNLKDLPIDSYIQQYLSDNSIPSNGNPEIGFRGIVRLPEAPMMVIRRPILTSLGEGPVRGTMVIGRYMDQSLIDELAATTLLPISADDYGKALASGTRPGVGPPTQANPISIQPLDSDTVLGQVLIDDIDGNPYLVASIEVPRTIYSQGRTAMAWIYSGICIFALLLIVINTRFLDRSVLARLRALGDSAEAIAKKGDFSSRIELKGRDELSQLAAQMNIMLSRLSEANRNLVESEKKYAALVEQSNDGILVISDGLVRYANNKIAQMFGVLPRDAISKKFLDFVSPEDRLTVGIYYAAGISGKPAPETYEIGLLHTSGKIVPVEISAKSVAIGGKPCDMVVVRDISYRKQTEAKLYSQKELIDRILANTPNAVLVVNNECKVMLANVAFYDMFDRIEGSAQGQNISEAIDNLELSEKVSEIASGSAADRQIEFTYSVKGSDKIFDARIIGMGNHEALIILREVTEERERQGKLLLTDRLVSIGEMASGIAYELNNPLASIAMLSEMLAKADIRGEDKEDLVTINKEAKRAALIVRNLLTFARKHEPDKKPGQINNVIEDVLGLRAYEHKVNNILVETNLETNLPEVSIDYFQIQQVFLNLVLNAEQAMISSHHHGRLTLATQRVNGKIIAKVKDDGPGIAPENLRRLFTPFFTTKEVGQGTGLGLSISYGIVASHGGRIYAQSELGSGTTFTIELPANTN